MDAVVPHRTVKFGGGIRINIEFRIRRRTSGAERIDSEQATAPGRLAHYVGIQDWYGFGSTKRMQFLDTYADAKRGIFIERAYDEPSYSVIDI